MSKKLIKAILMLTAVLFTGICLSTAVLASGEEGDDTPDPTEREEKMAHNIYMNPVIDTPYGEYTIFQIDFLGELTPMNTYWALCNWGMKGGFGAYSGLQSVDGGRRTAILSFWEGEIDGKILRAERMYPYGAESNFGGEGEGTNWIGDYDWKTGSWYRMLLYCWEDKETGNTFMGQWVIDLSSGEWTLMSAFNTKLKDSAMTGGLSQFQENFWKNRDYLARRFRIKNIYAYERNSEKWLSLNTSVMSYDPPEWGYETAGTHEFGAEADYFWGQAGEYVADQQAYDAKMPRRLTVSINQPDKPEISESEVTDLMAVNTNGNIGVSWKQSSNAAPVIKTVVSVLNENGDKIGVKTITRPWESSLIINRSYYSAYKVTLETTDVYGHVKDYSIDVDHTADNQPEDGYTLKRIETNYKVNKSEEYTATVSLQYLSEYAYCSKKIDPEEALKVSSLIEGVDNAKYIKVTYVKGSKKNAGETAFYPVYSLDRKALKKSELSKVDKNILKKAVKAINKAVKKDKCSFTIAPALLTDEALTINASIDKKGKLKIKKISLNITLWDGSSKTLKITKKNCDTSYNAEDNTVTVSGKNNFSGTVTKPLQ
ncbi:MAG: DUF3472 domain-containing protein [Lachnospiraceae bacterium]|nr:DUF3472 domain-containing protein [Lachnospiraceae bacterium]